VTRQHACWRRYERLEYVKFCHSLLSRDVRRSLCVFSHTCNGFGVCWLLICKNWRRLKPSSRNVNSLASTWHSVTSIRLYLARFVTSHACCNHVIRIITICSSGFSRFDIINGSRSISVIAHIMRMLASLMLLLVLFGNSFFLSFAATDCTV